MCEIVGREALHDGAPALGTCDQMHTHRGFYRDDHRSNPVTQPPGELLEWPTKHAPSVLVRGDVMDYHSWIGCAEPFGKVCEYVNGSHTIRGVTVTRSVGPHG